MSRSPKMADAAAVTTAESNAPASDGLRASPTPLPRKVIYTATVRFQAREKNIEVTRQKVIDIARQFDGFMLSSQNTVVVIKVPSEKLDAALNALKQMSDNFNKDLYAKDVTDRYYDIKIRLDNARKLRERFLQILKNARNVKDTLEVQRELSKVTERIERIEGQLKLLQSQISMSRITVNIYRKYVAPKRKEYKPGPLGWPFYVLYKGGAYAAKGIYWLFVWEETPKD